MSGTAAGVTIPPGSVPNLQEAANWHSQLASALHEHADTLNNADASLATSWEGVASNAYSYWSKHTVATFRDAAGHAEDASKALSNWAKQLHELQTRAKALQKDAVHQQALIAKTQPALSQAEAALKAMDHTGDINAAAADNLSTQISTLQTTLTGAQHALSTDQRQAEKIYTEAEGIAGQANRMLNQISVAVPPLLNSAPTPQVQPLLASSHPSSSGLAVPAVATTAAATTAAATASPTPTAAPANVAPTDVPTDLAPVSSGATQGAITFGDVEKIGKQYGWSQAQDAAWWKVIALESGGNPNATNPSSGAYGIGQFLGGTLTEYTPYGAASSNPMDQLNAMARYIHDRYGTPDAALSFHLAHNWY